MFKNMTLQEFKEAMGLNNTDPIVNAVCDDLQRRSALGIEKYGMTLDGNPLNLREWMEHAYCESLDFCLYLKRAMQEHDKTKK